MRDTLEQLTFLYITQYVDAYHLFVEFFVDACISVSMNPSIEPLINRIFVFLSERQHIYFLSRVLDTRIRTQPLAWQVSFSWEALVLTKRIQDAKRATCAKVEAT